MIIGTIARTLGVDRYLVIGSMAVILAVGAYGAKKTYDNSLRKQGAEELRKDLEANDRKTLKNKLEKDAELRRLSDDDLIDLFD